MRLFSDDLDRMVDDEAVLAIPAYERVHGEGYKYERVGVFESDADAKGWLERGEPKPKRLVIKTRGEA